MMQFVNEFTTVMNVERFALAGNSMGGAIAARFAIRYPERLTALILVNAAGMPTKSASDPGLGFLIARTPVIRNVMLYVSPRGLFEEGLKKAIVNDALVTPEMVDRYWILNRKTGNRAASLKRFQTPFDNFIPENVARISAPTLIIWGDKDTLLPPDIGQAYNAAIRGSKLMVFRNTGHAPMEEVPDQSARAVREFLNPSPSGSPPSQ
jgi:pimeloyl-ACP methyl ester carboxylesterase